MAIAYRHIYAYYRLTHYTGPSTWPKVDKSNAIHTENFLVLLLVWWHWQRRLSTVSDYRWWIWSSWLSDRGNRSTRRKSSQQPLSSRWTPRYLTLDWLNTCAMGAVRSSKFQSEYTPSYFNRQPSSNSASWESQIFQRVMFVLGSARCYRDNWS
jgi:hypothetical protein